MKNAQEIADILKRNDPRFAAAENVEFSDDAQHTYPWREHGELVGFVTMKFIHFYFSATAEIPHGSMDETTCSYLLTEGAYSPLVCYGWKNGIRDVMVSYQDRITI